MFSTEVDSAKFPNGATHWASVRTEVCACPEMVYGTLRQSEGGSTACSRHRQMSFQSWSQLAHLHQQEDMGSNPQHPHKKLRASVHVLVPACAGEGGKDYSHLLASPMIGGHAPAYTCICNIYKLILRRMCVF